MARVPMLSRVCRAWHRQHAAPEPRDHFQYYLPRAKFAGRLFGDSVLPQDLPRHGALHRVPARVPPEPAARRILLPHGGYPVRLNCRAGHVAYCSRDLVHDDEHFVSVGLLVEAGLH